MCSLFSQMAMYLYLMFFIHFACSLAFLYSSLFFYFITGHAPKGREIMYFAKVL